MNANARTIFALICLLGIIAVGIAALFEFRRMHRGESVITSTQFRLRMFSAWIWMVLLGSTSYAILMLWPETGNLGAGARPTPEQTLQAKRFLSVISGVFLLLIIALGLIAYDLVLFARQRKQKQAEFNRELAALAEIEIARLQNRGGPDNAASPMNSNPANSTPTDSAPKNGLPQ